MTRASHSLGRGLKAYIPILALLVAAPPAHAQLGIDLGGSAPRKQRTTKKKPATRKPAAPPKETLPDDIVAPPELAAPAAEAPKGDAAPAPTEPAAPPPPSRARRDQGKTGLTLKPADKAASAAAKARLDAAKKLLDEGATETAALAFDQILREGDLAGVHEEARFQRAKALARLGLRHSALASFDDILERGAASRFYQSSMEWLFHVGRGLANEQPLLARVARHAGQGVPAPYEDRVSYLLAKYEFERGRALADAGRKSEAKDAWGEARRLTGKVRGSLAAPATASAPSKDAAPDGGAPLDVAGRARFIDGLILYAQGDAQGAAEAFKDVVRLTNPKRVANPDTNVRELAFLQLARIHYESRQNRYALFYYGRMPWGGERWLEGLWEASWAHYRIGDYEKTLGNLLTLQSPYFSDEYFPESYVLKAIVYYENCRYPEARRVLEQFAAGYEPVYDELVRITGGQRTPDAYYDLVREAGLRSGPVRKILKVAYSDENVRRLAESIGEIETESDVGIAERRSEFRDSALGKELVQRLRADRAKLASEAGARARSKLEYERDQLRQLLAQALRIQIEVSRKEREALEGSIAKGSQVEVVRNIKYSHAVSDEHLYWPYEGEFWRDELGTYSYTLTKGCKDRLSRSHTAAR